MTTRTIYCCGCGTKVEARLTDGAEIYPRRTDLHSLPFWKCDACGNYVGTHHQTTNPTHPLGNIPTKELRAARQHIHRILDPIYKSGQMKRRALYAEISKRVGWEYHTAKLKTIDEARAVYKIVMEISNNAKN